MVGGTPVSCRSSSWRNKASLRRPALLALQHGQTKQQARQVEPPGNRQPRQPASDWPAPCLPSPTRSMNTRPGSPRAGGAAGWRHTADRLRLGAGNHRRRVLAPGAVRPQDFAAGPAVGQGPRPAAGPRQAGSRPAQAVSPRASAPRCPPAAAVLFAVGAAPAAWIVLAVLIVAASLEAFAGFCLGCVIFGLLQRRGLIPEDVCEACNNVPLRQL